MGRKYLYVSIIAILGLIAYLLTPSVPAPCHVVGSLPDPKCTPGQIMETDIKKICTVGYTKTVRNVSKDVWNNVFKEYGIATHTPETYEVDHLIPLELGGSNDISNLWAQSAPGFHVKDGIENYLHREVCAGKMSLIGAQIKIAKDWTQFLK